MLLAVALLAGAAWLLGGAGVIHGKALLAQWLIARAWAQQPDAARPRPWPWADTWPVARLSIPSLGETQYVLYGTNGQALAFGPGLDPTGAAPGEPGVVLLAGHRDTHFAWLAAVTPGDRLLLTVRGGSTRTYEVVRQRVLDSRAGPLRASLEDGLVLVTCFPFDAVAVGGPLRYVVEAAALTTSGQAPPRGPGLLELAAGPGRL
ncbi:LPXTG-site transpeptidase family protein [Pseudohaliea rubra DSM 19751]|uniref:LPXTG-site transpeptidase family protein n=1 Tax=Pseudohaliea rubra DSM 19751 TaxID=1265313 RepID=A0A095XXZ6_9GAMM|nr:LPXTG-site transpeptidase family protein [Pseudohaliea rubra DSM 19751]